MTASLPSLRVGLLVPGSQAKFVRASSYPPYLFKLTASAAQCGVHASFSPQVASPVSRRSACTLIRRQPLGQLFRRSVPRTIFGGDWDSYLGRRDSTSKSVIPLSPFHLTVGLPSRASRIFLRLLDQPSFLVIPYCNCSILLSFSCWLRRRSPLLYSPCQFADRRDNPPTRTRSPAQIFFLMLPPREPRPELDCGLSSPSS